jgi:hypothetical protein
MEKRNAAIILSLSQKRRRRNAAIINFPNSPCDKQMFAARHKLFESYPYDTTDCPGAKRAWTGIIRSSDFQDY